MRVHLDPAARKDFPLSPVVSIGNFDGVHLGHRAILEETIARAKRAGAPSAVVTFDPHPLRILVPERAPKMLLTLRQKEDLFAEIGIDHLFVIPFTRDFSLTPAAEFIRGFLSGALAVREVVIGRGFCFGHARSGDLSLLEALGRELGFSAHGVPDVLWNGAPISSTRIREALAAGDVATAAAMLGRPYAIEGLVARGAGRGKELGFPTVNVHPSGECRPGNGVYVTRIAIPPGDRTFESVTNVGTRPTLYENSAPTIESFVFDFDEEVYGADVRLELLARIREERAFPSVDALRARIAEDALFAREWFRANRAGGA